MTTSVPKSVPKRVDKFPLFVHKGRGYWCKTVLGKHFYFGKVADDPDGKAALTEWLRVKDYRLAGLEPPAPDSEVIGVKYLCNQFMAFKEAQLNGGNIEPITYNEQHGVCKMVLECIPGVIPVTALAPAHFTAVLNEINRRKKSPQTRGKTIGLVKSIFKFGYENGILDRPANFGVGFAKPPAKVMRAHRNAKGDQSFTPECFRKLYEHATLNGRAMMLLGLQAGFGNLELVELKRADIKDGFLVSPRAKTATMRRVPLWPETLVAIQQAIAAGPKDGELVFYKANGDSYRDSARTGWRITNVYSYIAKKAGVVGHSFYDLRRTFSTVAQNMQPLDLAAVESIMGHATGESDMTARYRQNIDDARLRAVTDHVRKWLGKLPKGGAK